jgi:hypothetical protein
MRSLRCSILGPAEYDGPSTYLRLQSSPHRRDRPGSPFSESLPPLSIPVRVNRGPGRLLTRVLEGYVIVPLLFYCVLLRAGVRHALLGTSSGVQLAVYVMHQSLNRIDIQGCLRRIE